MIGARGGNEDIVETNVSNVGDAGFVDAAAGDYRLLAGSPLIDSGDPVTQQGLDLDGNPWSRMESATASRGGTWGLTSSQPPRPAAGEAPQPVPGDTQPPVVTGFRAAPALFATARAGTPRAARAPRGTRFRYTLSEAARVTLTIQRRRPGRPRTVGTLRRSAGRGTNSTRFTGRIGTRALSPAPPRAHPRQRQRRQPLGLQGDPLADRRQNAVY